MIQTAVNCYNINFKAARAKSAPSKDMPEQVRNIIMLAAKTSPIREHTVKLSEYGIRITGYRLDEKIENKVHMCFNKDTLDLSCKPGTLSIGAVGEVETVQDARKLMFETIREAWKFFLESAPEHYFKR